MTRSEPYYPEPASPLEMRLTEAADMLRAIRYGEIDALVVEGPDGNQVYTLHSAEEPYRTLVEQMQEGAVVLSDRGDILYANARFAALVDEPLESLAGSRLDRFVAVSDRDGVEALIRRGSGRCQSRLVGSGSQSVDVNLSLTTTTSVAGHRLNLIVSDLRDLIAATSTRDLAQRESRTKDEFLATFAHELRTPLGAIGAAAQLLEATRAAAGTGSPRPYEVIVRQVDHVSRLINDLLDVERVVSGKVRLNRRPVNVADAVRQVVATFTGVAPADRHITLSTEPVWVEWDATRLQQVLTNIMTNAVKYTPAGGAIRVAVRAEGDDAVLSVEDTGYGISPQLLPVIFDMFVQVDRTLDHAQNGLGIGLALVRRLVELHGGTVVASSDGEGHGSTFTLRLARIPAPHDSSGRNFIPEHRARPRRVLLIEDGGDARQRLRLMLELAGHEVYGAADVLGGLELLKTVRPDVGIIDVSSPMVDRRLVARRIRKEPHGREMLLVALGADGVPDGSNRPPEDGFDLHLVNPVDAEHLALVLADAATQAHSAGY
jgi:signal transduction histidine kinase